MALLKFQYRKKNVVVNAKHFKEGLSVGFTIIYGVDCIGPIYFYYQFNRELIDNPNADFLCFLKSFVKSYIDLQFYGRLS